MTTKDKKNSVMDMVKNHANQTDTTPQQEVTVKTKQAKKKPVRFTVDIEEDLLEKVKAYGFTNKMKLRKIFETALEEFVSKDNQG